LNGQQVDSKSTTGLGTSLYSNDNSLIIGAAYDTGGSNIVSNFKGFIDQVTIFNDAVDPGEAKSWYDMGRAD
ncbi:MAG: hypothetical protein JXR97_14420, partial [Planctomycetes bacterium]|nr:hypothetical protein [Planctomycetota bacterium]